MNTGSVIWSVSIAYFYATHHWIAATVLLIGGIIAIIGDNR